MGFTNLVMCVGALGFVSLVLLLLRPESKQEEIRQNAGHSNGLPLDPECSEEVQGLSYDELEKNKESYRTWALKLWWDRHHADRAKLAAEDVAEKMERKMKKMETWMKKMGKERDDARGEAEMLRKEIQEQHKCKKERDDARGEAFLLRQEIQEHKKYKKERDNARREAAMLRKEKSEQHKKCKKEKKKLQDEIKSLKLKATAAHREPSSIPLPSVETREAGTQTIPMVTDSATQTIAVRTTESATETPIQTRDSEVQESVAPTFEVPQAPVVNSPPRTELGAQSSQNIEHHVDVAPAYRQATDAAMDLDEPASPPLTPLTVPSSPFSEYFPDHYDPQDVEDLELAFRSLRIDDVVDDVPVEDSAPVKDNAPVNNVQSNQAARSPSPENTPMPDAPVPETPLPEAPVQEAPMPDAPDNSADRSEEIDQTEFQQDQSVSMNHEDTAPSAFGLEHDNIQDSGTANLGYDAAVASGPSGSQQAGQANLGPELAEDFVCDIVDTGLPSDDFDYDAVVVPGPSETQLSGAANTITDGFQFDSSARALASASSDQPASVDHLNTIDQLASIGQPDTSSPFPATDNPAPTMTTTQQRTMDSSGASSSHAPLGGRRVAPIRRRFGQQTAPPVPLPLPSTRVPTPPPLAPPSANPLCFGHDEEGDIVLPSGSRGVLGQVGQTTIAGGTGLTLQVPVSSASQQQAPAQAQPAQAQAAQTISQQQGYNPNEVNFGDDDL